MKKVIVGVVLLLIGAVSAIPFVSGLVMEKTVRRVCDDANALYAATGAGYSLEIVSYDRGYLTSDIEWKFDLGVLKQIYPIAAIVFSDHARHGFTGVVSITSLGKNDWYADFVAGPLKGRDPLHITTVYGFSGGIESTVVLDAFPVTVDGETVDVKAGRMVMATDRHLKHFTGSGNWAGMSAGDVLTIGEVSMDHGLTRFSPYLWAGDIRYGIGRVSLREKGNAVEMRDLKGDYTLSVSDDRSATSLAAQFSMGGLNAGNVAIDDAAVQLAVNGVDADGYAAFMKAYTRNISQFLGSMAALQGDPKAAEAAVKQQMAMIGFQMMAAYEKLLKKGLEFRISDLHAKLADGEINGGMTLRLLKDMTFMQFAPVASQPELLFDILYLKTDLSLPADLAGENPKLLMPAFPGMQTGLFVKQGPRLTHRAETVAGKLMLNGTEVTLPGQHVVQPISVSAIKARAERL